MQEPEVRVAVARQQFHPGAAHRAIDGLDALAPCRRRLDEHTAALDPRTADIVMQATTRLVAEHRLTTLMVTHNMRHALECGSRLLMMNAGRIKLDLAGVGKSKLTAPELVRRFGEEDDQILLPGEV